LKRILYLIIQIGSGFDCTAVVQRLRNMMRISVRIYCSILEI